jgi:hypothetical protein
MGRAAGSGTPSSSGTASNRARPIDQQAAAKTLGHLVESVNWGDLVSARQELDTLTRQLGKVVAREGSTPLAQLIVRLRGDLAQGDPVAAQQSVAAFVASLQGGAGNVAHAVSKQQAIPEAVRTLQS